MRALARTFRLVLVLGAFLAVASAQKIEVDTAFPGGNIIVDSIEGDTIAVHRDLRDTLGDWFYYYFRVRGAAGRAITVRFTENRPMTARGPAVSTDGGATWSWLGAEQVSGDTFRYSVPTAAKEVRFCLAMPYMEANLKAFLARHRGNRNLRVSTLCKTRKGRDTEALYLGRLDGACRLRALITARHHACEMMASHELQGMMEAILAKGPDGKWFRTNVEFLIIPFMDKDGVEDGDQGKNRKPWDHNRDYVGESIYPSVAALRALAPKWSEGKLQFALDLHCPMHVGRGHEVIYGLSGSPEAERFARILEATQTLEATQPRLLAFRLEDHRPIGASEEQKKRSPEPARGVVSGMGRIHQDEPGRKRFDQWARELPGMRLSTLVELPYANATGRSVTIESATAFGHDLARALRRYLSETLK